ncbi:LAMI_0D09164g1_1 [Lachancea mirantina]|uniref:LAMI_0D09164g1_1 n=1 Tax=Lachancea mirantina TaxID=1230905 RepID=A0A1G4JE04_9SACH|nr:LAMI_0D09164g1_1 [Lachancea mirantina]
MSSQPVREAALKLVKGLEQLPLERIKHIVSLKESQIERYSPVAGLGSSKNDGKAKPSLEDIKDIISRTSGPLGMQKDALKKIQAALPQEQFTVDGIQEQIRSLQALLSNKNKNYYDVGDKLYKPAGNPIYYQRLLDEIEGKKKETFLTALRTVLFGK